MHTLIVAHQGLPCSTVIWIHSRPTAIFEQTVLLKDVRWPKFVGTGTERNAFPFKKDLSLSRFFSFFLFLGTGLFTLSTLSLD